MTLLKKIILIIFIFLIFINFSLFSKELQLPYKIVQKKSNIFYNIFIFSFPICNNYETNFFYEAESYSIEIYIKKNNINNEPSSSLLFETDLFFRIDNIPYNQVGKFNLDITIRVNKKFITFKSYFTIKQKDKFLYLKGKTKELKFKDITKEEAFLKRGEVRIPIIFDLVITSSF